MITKEVKKKWLEALRSGNYNQGKHFLEFQNEFCCLGVLCKVVGKPTKHEDGLLKKYPMGPFVEFEGLSFTIQKHLASMNDRGEPFKKIAAYISRNVKAKD